MEVILAIVVGYLFAVGVYLILMRDIFRLIMGLVILSQAANLLVFTAGGLTHAKPPIIPETATAFVQLYADPLPQALILMAIVMSFSILAFLLVLVYRAHKTIDVNDVDRMKGENV